MCRNPCSSCFENTKLKLQLVWRASRGWPSKLWDVTGQQWNQVPAVTMLTASASSRSGAVIATACGANQGCANAAQPWHEPEGGIVNCVQYRHRYGDLGCTWGWL